MEVEVHCAVIFLLLLGGVFDENQWRNNLSKFTLFFNLIIVHWRYPSILSVGLSDGGSLCTVHCAMCTVHCAQWGWRRCTVQWFTTWLGLRADRRRRSGSRKIYQPNLPSLHSVFLSAINNTKLLSTVHAHKPYLQSVLLSRKLLSTEYSNVLNARTSLKWELQCALQMWPKL